MNLDIFAFGASSECDYRLAIILFVGVPLLALIIRGLVRHFRRAARERTLSRMEMGKLAEEAHILRKELEGSQNEETHSR